MTFKELPTDALFYFRNDPSRRLCRKLRASVYGLDEAFYPYGQAVDDDTLPVVAADIVRDSDILPHLRGRSLQSDD